MPRLPKPERCRGCLGDAWIHPVPNTRRLTAPHEGFSNNEGNGTNGVLVVGEALGANEDGDALPFRLQAQAGSLLERAFKRCGYSRNQFRLTNVVRCRPPHDLLADTSYEFSVIQSCRPYLLDTLQEMKPRVIFALGGVAARELTGYEGKKQGISYIRGYVLPCALPNWAHVPVVSTFHPSFIRQGKPQMFGVLCHDMRRAVEYARVGGQFASTHQHSEPIHRKCPDCGDNPQRGCFLCEGTGEYNSTIGSDIDIMGWQPTGAAPIERRYQTHPSLDDARSFLLRCKDALARPLTYDIETPTSAEEDEDEREEWGNDIVQIQFSLAEGEGIVFPWEPGYVEVALEILKLQHTKYSFYGHLFDDPKLRANGATFGGPFPVDLYEMWHHMQPDLPANLQFVASFYGMDLAGPWKHLAGLDARFYGCADVDAPQRILARLPQQLQKRALWEGYEELVYKVRPGLDRMSERGIPINDERRQAFGLELDKAASEVDAEMQQLVPDALKNVQPKQGYKRDPKDTTGMVQRVFSGYTDVDGQADPTGVLRWCRMEPFKPSSQQLIRYMKHKGHPVPINIKKGRETSEAKELERLAVKTHDPLYRKVIWYREVKLMKATFVDGWRPAPDGRVHTTFTFAPATGQLSSRDPNVQNAPEHAKEGREDQSLADKFQRIIEAPVGYKIVSFDHKSFHALTLAWLAQDPDYERIVRMDVHSFVASEFLKLKRIDEMMSMQDDELRQYLKWVKKTHTFVRDYKCKRVILGWGFGRGYRSIYNAYMESFEGEGETKRLVQTLESGFQKTVKFRKQIMSKAHYDTFLISRWGFIRWFWDVYYFDPRTGAQRNGEQAEQAIAFLPANTAFGMMRAQEREMESKGLDERYGLINNVHDSWKFCCADALVDECLWTIKGLMEAPCKTLTAPLHPDGLWCAVSASVGQNNAKKSPENPDGKEEVEVNVPSPSAAVVV